MAISSRDLPNEIPQSHRFLEEFLEVWAQYWQSWSIRPKLPSCLSVYYLLILPRCNTCHHHQRLCILRLIGPYTKVVLLLLLLLLLTYLHDDSSFFPLNGVDSMSTVIGEPFKTVTKLVSFPGNFSPFELTPKCQNIVRIFTLTCQINLNRCWHGLLLRQNGVRNTNFEVIRLFECHCGLQRPQKLCYNITNSTYIQLQCCNWNAKKA